MTAWRLEPMDITKRWVFLPVMLCQALTAAVLSCCLFAGLSASSLVLSKWKACSMGLRSGDWQPNQLCWIWLNVRRLNVPIYLRIYAAASVFRHFINKCWWPSDTGSHSCQCHYTASTMFYRRCGVLKIMSCSKTSPYFSLTLWYRRILVSSVLSCSGTGLAFFRCVLANSNLAFLFLRLLNGFTWIMILPLSGESSSLH